MSGLAWALGAALAAPYHGDVTQPTVVWETLETERFAIHFMAGDRRWRPVDARPYAEALALHADTLLLDLCYALGVDVPVGRLHVLVLDRADEVEGYTLPHWDWIVLSAHPGSQVTRMRGRADPALDALAHELGHVVAHKAATALPESLAYGIDLGGTVEGAAGGVGLRLPLGHDRPYGWSEGMAEWLSEAVGVNRWSTERAARLRAAARDDRLLTWEELQRNEDKDPGDAERAYQQGYAFARWLEARYGAEVLGRWARARAAAGWPTWSRLLERVTGTPARALHEAFVADVRSEAAAVDAAIEAEGLAEGEELLTWRPTWRRTERWAVDSWWERSPREREVAREATGSWRLCPTWSGGRLLDGRVGWVVAGTWQEGDLPGVGAGWPELPGDRPRDLWIPARFGRGFALAADGETAWVIGPEHPSWQVRLEDGFDFDTVWAVDLDSPDLPVRQRMRAVPGTRRAMDVAVAPDGARMAFLRFEGGGQALVVGPSDGSDWQVVDRWGLEADALGLSFAPDGERLVTSMRRGGMVDLWVMDLPTRTWSARTRDPWIEQDPTWTAEGIVFAADPDGRSDAFLLDDDDRVTRLTRTRDGVQCPRPTPSGHLLYSAPTSAGTKAMGLARHHLAGEDVTGRFGVAPAPALVQAALDHVRPAPEAVAAPYRRAASLLPPVWGPFARVDVSGVEVSPSVGAYGTVGDAAERGELALWARVGDDLELELQATEQSTWPVLSVWGGTRRERRRSLDGLVDRRGLDAVGLSAARALRPTVELELEALALRVLRTSVDGSLRGAVEGQRAALHLRYDGLDDALDATGLDAALHATAARSLQPESSPLGPSEALSWGRLGLELAADVALVRGEAPPRLELAGQAVATSARLSDDEAIPVGGPTPWALRPTAVTPSLPMPGYAPWAWVGDSVAAGSVGVALPLAARVRSQVGPWAFRRLELEAGADGAVGARRSVDGSGTPATVLADARLGVRLASLVRDARFDSRIAVAAPFGPDLVRPSPLGVVPAAHGWPQGIRLILGVGTGW